MKPIRTAMAMATGMLLTTQGFSSEVKSPVAKVISMLSDLQAKVIREGEVAQKEYAEFAEWCEERGANLGFEIKTGKAQVETLKSTSAREASTVSSLTTKVEELASALSVNQADLKAATQIRHEEQTAFAASEKELVDVVNMLGRASVIVEREMNKGSASMLQLKGVHNLEQAFSALVQASVIQSSDAGKLSSFVQSMQEDEEDDMGAPAAAVYTSHSGDILSTLQDLKEKAESQLETARNTETADRHNYEMLKQSLEDEISYGQKEMEEAKRGIAESSEKKATADGDLGVTSKELDEDIKAKSTLHHDCMTKAEDFEAETKSRGEELTALAKAKEIIKEATGGSLSQVSFLQLVRGRVTSETDLSIFEAVRLVRDLGRKQHSNMLTQLASKMAHAMHTGGDDQFQKVKVLIRDMIAKLEGDAESDASAKAWCDKSLAETRQKKSDKTDEISKLGAKIDMMSSKSAQLKSEVSVLQDQLAKLAKSQAELTRLRREEKAANAASRADLEKGLQGLKLGLQIITEYYSGTDKAHSAADGAANGIIGLLEVCESDFTRDLARVIADEESAVAEYEKVSKENEIERTTKNQDVSYKTKEFKNLDQDSAELSSDRSTVQVELDAALESLSKLEAQCIAKAETYGERKAGFEAEIAGLKEALSILENEAALLQRATRRKLRGLLAV